MKLEAQTYVWNTEMCKTGWSDRHWWATHCSTSKYQGWASDPFYLSQCCIFPLWWSSSAFYISHLCRTCNKNLGLQLIIDKTTFPVENVGKHGRKNPWHSVCKDTYISFALQSFGTAAGRKKEPSNLMEIQGRERPQTRSIFIPFRNLKQQFWNGKRKLLWTQEHPKKKKKVKPRGSLLGRTQFWEQQESHLSKEPGVWKGPSGCLLKGLFNPKPSLSPDTGYLDHLSSKRDSAFGPPVVKLHFIFYPGRRLILFTLVSWNDYTLLMFFVLVFQLQCF